MDKRLYAIALCGVCLSVPATASANAGRVDDISSAPGVESQSVVNRTVVSAGRILFSIPPIQWALGRISVYADSFTDRFTLEGGLERQHAFDATSYALAGIQFGAEQKLSFPLRSGHRWWVLSRQAELHASAGSTLNDVSGQFRVTFGARYFVKQDMSLGLSFTESDNDTRYMSVSLNVQSR